ncbi:zinc finger and BTB domain-containing protein 11 isoform X2 [Bombina bombina]|uniref:zinc finger and BTB domain-containing protein 11 isoform X2 n=1 Tax=Bombina bombina TaxID=8345 RepID=UPI00235A59F8|nr:zinc finger and BTB domain-containing protein 11 isoform X2 [Bombina bombina]
MAAVLEECYSFARALDGSTISCYLVFQTPTYVSLQVNLIIEVDSKGLVKQSSSKHGQTVLDQLNQQRFSNQFCDVTLLIEGEEYRAHKSVLAASSDYFRELFIEKGALSSHEAVVDLSGFFRSSFLPLLEFAYTSELSFDFCNMAEVAMLARHLFMHEVLEICESVHKQMESKQLTLYQKGDVQTVASEKSLMENNQSKVDYAAPLVSNDVNNHQVTVMQSEGMKGDDAKATQADAQALANTSPPIAVGLSQLAMESTVQIVSGDEVPISSLAGTTAIYISSVPSELQPAVIIPAVINVATVQPEVQQTFCITPDVNISDVQAASPPTSCNEASACEEVHEQSVLCDLSKAKLPENSTQPQQSHLKEDSVPGICADPKPKVISDAVSLGSVLALDTLSAENMDKESIETKLNTCSKEGTKRKRGRPPKSQMELTNNLDMIESADESSYKSKLRERSVGEGGYIQMHKGLEKKLVNRNTTPKSAVQQAAMKLVQRGKKKRILPPKKETADVESEYKCNECGMEFQRRYALIMHNLTHERSKEFKCPLCKKEFQYKVSLRAHLVRHSRIETNSEVSKGKTKRQFICDICGRTLPKLYSLRIHMLKHTGVKPHVCKICGKTFTYKHGLKMHQAMHGTQPFKCDICEKTFVTSRSLQEHVSTHTGETKYLCSVCGKAFHRASGLSKHTKKHKPRVETRGFQCTQCDRSFFESRDLQQHMNKHLGVKPFECEFCGKCYTWKKDWYSHVKSHSVTEPYRCNICGKEFYEKALFRRHVNKATHGKKGRAKQNVERVCDHCGKTFTQLREYRRHINNHEGVKPFECLTCGVAWADARSLKRHVRTHTGERPYVCPVCNEAYIDARTLRKHMTKFHSDYVPCKIMLEKDTLQFHNQGTQVEHAVNILSADLQEQNEEITEEVETVLVSGEVIEAIEAVANTQEGTSVSTLSDQSIMQVVNYVLSQQQGQKIVEVAEHIETVEVEVGHISETVCP